MELYITIHALILMTCFFEFSKNLKTKRNVIIIWCLFFTLFGGLRWNVGNDWDQYLSHFENVEWNSIFNYDRYGDGRQTMEPFFLMINYVVKFLFGEFFIYNLIIVGFLEYTFYKFAYKQMPEHPVLLYCLIHTAMVYFPVRAGFALGFCYWAYAFIKERDLKKFLISVLIGASIHMQVIVLIPFYWIGIIKLNWKICLIACIAALSVGYLLQDYVLGLALISGGDIEEKLVTYAEWQTVEDSALNYSNAIMYFIYLFIFLYVRKLLCKTDDLWYNTVLNSYMIYVSMYFIFINGMSDLVRIQDVFVPAYYILYSTMIVSICKYKKGVISVLFVSLLLAYNIRQLPRVGGVFAEKTCVPYTSIFDFPNIF